MKTICLSSSLKYKDLIRETTQEFRRVGIKALFPNLDSGLDKDRLDMKTIKKLCRDHLRAIDDSEALYVLDPDGYIGTFVKIEIGYALGRGKPVYFSEKANSLDLDSLPKDIVPINLIERFLRM